MITRKVAEWLAVLLFVGIVAVVFQQIHTSMAEQGIASGGPYDNAAAYPKAIALLIGVLVAAQAGVLVLRRAKTDPSQALPAAELRRGAMIVGVFAAYLMGLGTLGYHLSTPCMIAATMWIGGLRRPIVMLAFAIGLSLAVSYFFEVFLKIVLPGGMFGLNIAW